MKGNWIDADKLIDSIRKKWREEHPSEYDTSGSMTYQEIISFIKDFAEEKDK